MDGVRKRLGCEDCFLCFEGDNDINAVPVFEFFENSVDIGVHGIFE